MDKEQKKRITSNITFLKERLGYLDPILDHLVDRNVFTYDERERIDKVNPPTPHKKFNEFIQLLLASSEPHAFTSFIQSLEEERFFNIVEKLCKDGFPGRPNARASSSMVRESALAQQLRPQTSMQPRKEHTVHATTGVYHMSSEASVTQILGPHSAEHHQLPQQHHPQHAVVGASGGRNDSGFASGASGASPASDRVNQMTMDRMTTAIGQMFAEFSGKVTNDLLDGFERRRHEERMEIELSMERKISQEIERKMDEKLNAFRGDWEDQKTSLIDRNEKALFSLQDSVEQLRNSSDAYNQLKQKYDQLQQTHAQMRDKENERWSKLSTTNKENTQLRSELEMSNIEIINLRERVDELESDNRAMKDNELTDQHRINQMVAEKEDLIIELERAEREKMDLKMRVDSLSREIERLLMQQQERANKDDKAYQEALKKQNERLDELYKVVQALTERERQSKTLFIGGNAVQKSARMSRPNK
ncbi:centromere-associated protein E-like isoform X2 [Mizuhopecten yessoensis]|uniref:centromere-associated protein E-like isoform X2 n=1 Tax=Mizuhopecten yessoensis TaxID=6573 RepID=UPI000B4571BD|nr:centromere-associated protein E-like isoform X2 [Mizuhopecten yessoensis]